MTTAKIRTALKECEDCLSDCEKARQEEARDIAWYEKEIKALKGEVEPSIETRYAVLSWPTKDLLRSSYERMRDELKARTEDRRKLMSRLNVLAEPMKRSLRVAEALDLD